VDITKIEAGAASTEAEIVLEQAGTYILAVELRPRPIELSAEDFNEYLAHEGLNHVLQAREKAKKNDDLGRELYAKFAKSILHLGSPEEEVATKPIGLKLEIVPQRDPASVSPGEKLTLKVLFDGKPLSNAQLGIVSDVAPGNAVEEGEPYLTTLTSFEGIASIPISSPGTWLVRLVHMIPAGDGKPHDWESFFSTLTFRVPPEKGFPLNARLPTLRFLGG
jgi:hypothetical protein